MAISNMDQLVAAMSSSPQTIAWNKTNATSEGSGTYFDHFLVAGVPGAGATPADASVGGTTYTLASQGGIAFTAPSGSNLTYTLSWSVSNTQAGSIYLYDRLWACSGLATGAGATTTISGMTNISRYSNGVGAEIYYVCLTAPSAQSANMTITVTYTNSDGVGSRTGTVVLSAGSPPPTANQAYPLSLQAGDKGIRSIQSVTNTSGSFTGGTHGLVVGKRIAGAHCAIACNGMLVDGLKLGLPQIPNDACLNFISVCSTTTTGYWAGTLTLVQG